MKMGVNGWNGEVGIQCVEADTFQSLVQTTKTQIWILWTELRGKPDGEHCTASERPYNNMYEYIRKYKNM